ncbi:calcium-binding protein [Chroococcus sp. FPU101]|uniref:calcium-binding protein n=1 Tax=Chroococcus sp. FPU101 TaxID=1974212 RepID=UPI001A8F6F06|nr:calcium-binding protein [Chroococcus sp. FPU101]GFE69055.1 hypothetical protein CFPU101_16650 [Chroococcus sp. FPU101]
MSNYDLFDAQYYARYNPDLAKAGLITEAQLRQHFETHGIDEGRSFNPFVSLYSYKQVNPDLVFFSNHQLYNHIQEFGIAEQRRFSLFETTQLSDHSTSNDDLRFGTKGNDVLSGGFGFDKIFGGMGNDTLYGDQGTDWLEGGSGNDQLHSDDGAGMLYGGTGNDSLYGGIVNDTLYGEIGNDELLGNKGSDWLVGGESGDWLYGGDGSDTLIGGHSSVQSGKGTDSTDYLIGNAGADCFRFMNLGVPDFISDFSIADGDKIEISKTGIGVTSSSKFRYDVNTGTFLFFVNGFGSNGIIYAGQAIAVLDQSLNFDVNRDMVLI